MMLNKLIVWTISTTSISMITTGVLLTFVSKDSRSQNVNRIVDHQTNLKTPAEIALG